MTSSLIFYLSAYQRHLDFEVLDTLWWDFKRIFGKDRNVGELADLQCALSFSSKPTHEAVVVCIANASATLILSSGIYTSSQRILRDTQAAISRSGSTGQYPGGRPELSSVNIGDTHLPARSVRASHPPDLDLST